MYYLDKDNDDIRYIIKFFQHEEYAKTFVEERCFYTNPVGYYCNVEGGRGVALEASIIGRPLERVCENISIVDIKYGNGTPIFCCYMVVENEVLNNRIFNIDKRCVRDFMDKKGGVAVVIRYEEFHKALWSCPEIVKYGRVNYYEELSIDDTVKLSKFPLVAIFNKNIQYSYQKEYRIAFDGIVEGELKEDEERIRLEYEDCSRKYYYTDKIDIIGAYRGNSFVEDENGLYMLEM